jgi:Ca2+-dependent lipid-binding protein
MDHQDINMSLIDFFLTPGSGGGPAGIILLLTAWFVGWMGMSSTFVFFIAFVAYGYWYRQTRRLRRHVTWGLQTIIREPTMARAILGNDIPHWVTFSHVEKSQWVQNVLQNLWPHIAKTARLSMIQSLDPLLEKFRPKGLLSKLQMGHIDFGDIPPTIDGFQAHTTEKETVIDIHLHWSGNPDIRVLAHMGFTQVEASVTNLQLRALTRITLAPHCLVWPCFGSMSVSFVGKPLVDFNLKAAKIPFDAIPGLSGWLDGFIRNTLAWVLVYPRRMVIRIISDELIQSQEVDVDPVGCLIVNIDKASNLPEAGLFSSVNTYVAVTSTIGDDSKAVVHRTRNVKGTSPIYSDDELFRGQNVGASRRKQRSMLPSLPTLNHKRGGGGEVLSSRMVFPVYHVPSEQLIIEVKEAQSKVSTLTKMLREDLPLGKVELLVGSLMGEKYVSNSRLISPTKPTSDVGTIAFSTEYRPFLRDDEGEEEDDEAGGLTDGTRPSSGNLSPSRSSGVFASGVKATSVHSGTMMDLQKNNNRHQKDGGGLSASAVPASKLAGLLLIHLEKASNLISADINGSSDPYIVLRVGRQQAITEVISGSLNPKFDCKQQVMVDDVSKDVLEVLVYDEDRFQKHDLLGKVSIPLMSIHQNHDRMSMQQFKLDTQGAVTMSIRLKVYLNF